MEVAMIHGAHKAGKSAGSYKWILVGFFGVHSIGGKVVWKQKFLSQLQAQDRVALYTLTTHLAVLHDFTSDATPLLRALERYKGHHSAALAACEPAPADTGVDQIDAFLDDANQRVSDFYVKNRVRLTAPALEAIANHLAQLPGRKNLIWVSGGFPFYIGFDDMPASSTQGPTVFNEEVERSVSCAPLSPQPPPPGLLRSRAFAHR